MQPAEIARLRLHNQRLAGTSLEQPEEVVRWLGAVQSQDYLGAKRGLEQRTSGGLGVCGVRSTPHTPKFTLNCVTSNY